MRRSVLCVALVAAAITALMPASSVSAQDDALVVQSGAGLGRNVPGFTSRMMVPHVDGVPTIQVHTDDVINVRGSMLLLPQNFDPESWREAAAAEEGDPYFVLKADPDADIPGINAPHGLNAILFSPSNPECGDSAENPCSFDGTNEDPVAGVYNPGDVGEFFVRITAQPNSVIWATPQIPSPPEANLRIEVVPPGAEATTQEEVDAARSSLRQQDRQTALGLIESLNQVNKHREDGRLVYEVWAGFDEGPVSLLAFFPQNLRIKRGSTVRFRFDHLESEPHTATLPFKAATKTVRNGFVPACDPDGDDGPGPDEPAEFGEQGPNCPQPEQFEFDLNRRLTAEFGDGVFPGGRRRYESSGLRSPILPTGLPGLAGGTDPWDLRFNKRSGDDGYRYLCAFHGRFMSGSIRVRR